MEQPPDQEPLNSMVLTKGFNPDLEELGKDFTSEENKAKRAAYEASYTKDQKKKVYDAWVLFMREISRNIPFFIYFERYYGQQKQFRVSTKTLITLNYFMDISPIPHILFYIYFMVTLSFPIIYFFFLSSGNVSQSIQRKGNLFLPLS